MNNIWQRKSHLRDLFATFLDKQTDTAAIFSNKARFYKFKVVFRIPYLRNEFGDPQSFCSFDMSNLRLVKVSEKK